MSDPLHARMSTAIIGWLGDAIGDYARYLLANDMDDLVGTLEEHGVGVTLVGDNPLGKKIEELPLVRVEFIAPEGTSDA